MTKEERDKAFADLIHRVEADLPGLKAEMMAQSRIDSSHLTEAQLEASWEQMVHQFGF